MYVCTKRDTSRHSAIGLTTACALARRTVGFLQLGLPRACLRWKNKGKYQTRVLLRPNNRREARRNHGAENIKHGLAKSMSNQKRNQRRFEGTPLAAEGLRGFQSIAHRVFANNGATHTTTTRVAPDSLIRATEHPETANCPICLNDDPSFATHAVRLTRCNHVFCEFCIIDWAKQGSRRCPLCNGPFAIFQQPSPFPGEFFFGEGRILMRNSLWDTAGCNPPAPPRTASDATEASAEFTERHTLRHTLISSVNAGCAAESKT